MKKLMLGAVTLGLLTGCTSSQYVAAPGVATHEGMTIVQHEDGNYLGSVSFRRFYTDVSEVALRQCLAVGVQATQAQDATMGNEQGGQPQNIRTSKNLDENYVNGNVRTNQGILRYRLELQLIPDSNYYDFSRLGFLPEGTQGKVSSVRAWEGTNPMAVHSVLENITDTIQHCLAQSVDGSK